MTASARAWICSASLLLPAVEAYIREKRQGSDASKGADRREVWAEGLIATAGAVESRQQQQQRPDFLLLLLPQKSGRRSGTPARAGPRSLLTTHLTRCSGWGSERMKSLWKKRENE